MIRLKLTSNALSILPFGIGMHHQVLATANHARDRGDWTYAAEQYQRYLGKKPHDFAVWVQLGHTLKECGFRIKALVAYSRALALDGSDPDLLLNLGHLHKMMGHSELAADFYRRSAEADGNSDALEHLSAMGLCFAPMVEALSPALSSPNTAVWSPWGQTRARLRAFISPTTRKLLARADEARAGRDWPMAANLYRAYLQARPDHFAIWVQLGHMLKESGQHGEALAAYERALAINDQDADLLLNLGHLQKRTGDIESAIKFYRQSADKDGNLNALNELKQLGCGLIA